MSNLSERIDNFFLEQKERFVKEFSFVFETKDPINFEIKVEDLKDTRNSKRDNKILNLYTNDKGFLNVKEYLEDSNSNYKKIFFKACQLNNMCVIKYLLKKYPTDINKFLDISARYGYLNIVKFLIESGACIENSNSLLISAKHGYFDIVKYLIESGAKTGKEFALSQSSSNGHIDIVKYLVENGARINSSLALRNSAYNGNFEIVKYLVENGARVNNKFALIYSAKYGHLEIVKYLVELGANINRTNALSASAINGHLPVVKYLVSKGANIGDAITNSDNDINRFLFMHSKPEDENRFDPQIVSDLKAIKELIN